VLHILCKWPNILSGSIAFVVVTHEASMLTVPGLHFKSAHNPAHVVFPSFGMEFQLFAPKSIDRDGVNPLSIERVAYGRN
jgi:hypothetical protein